METSSGAKYIKWTRGQGYSPMVDTSGEPLFEARTECDESGETSTADTDVEWIFTVTGTRGKNKKKTQYTVDDLDAAQVLALSWDVASTMTAKDGKRGTFPRVKLTQAEMRKAKKVKDTVKERVASHLKQDCTNVTLDTVPGHEPDMNDKDQYPYQRSARSWKAHEDDAAKAEEDREAGKPQRTKETQQAKETRWERRRSGAAIRELGQKPAAMIGATITKHFANYGTATGKVVSHEMGDDHTRYYHVRYYGSSGTERLDLNELNAWSLTLEAKHGEALCPGQVGEEEDDREDDGWSFCWGCHQRDGAVKRVCGGTNRTTGDTCGHEWHVACIDKGGQHGTTSRTAWTCAWCQRPERPTQEQTLSGDSSESDEGGGGMSGGGQSSSSSGSSSSSSRSSSSASTGNSSSSGKGGTSNSSSSSSSSSSSGSSSSRSSSSSSSSSSKRKAAGSRRSSTPTSAAGKKGKGKRAIGEEDRVVGRRITKKFPNGNTYPGTIDSTDHDEATLKKIYHVLYEDGDEEDLFWHEIEPLLVQEKDGSGGNPDPEEEVIRVTVHEATRAQLGEEHEREKKKDPRSKRNKKQATRDYKWDKHNGRSEPATTGASGASAGTATGTRATDLSIGGAHKKSSGDDGATAGRPKNIEQGGPKEGTKRKHSTTVDEDDTGDAAKTATAPRGGRRRRSRAPQQRIHSLRAGAAQAEAEKSPRAERWTAKRGRRKRPQNESMATETVTAAEAVKTVETATTAPVTGRRWRERK